MSFSRLVVTLGLMVAMVCVPAQEPRAAWFNGAPSLLDVLRLVHCVTGTGSCDDLEPGGGAPDCSWDDGEIWDGEQCRAETVVEPDTVVCVPPSEPFRFAFDGSDDELSLVGAASYGVVDGKQSLILGDSGTNYGDISDVEHLMRSSEGAGDADFSVAVWIRKTGGGNGVIIARNHSNGNGNRFIFAVTSTGRIFVSEGWNSASNHSAENTISLNTWHHVIFAYNAATNAVTTYVDGSPISVGRTTIISGAFTSTDTVSIGQEFDGTTPSDFFRGALSGLTIYDYKVSTIQAGEIYANE